IQSGISGLVGDEVTAFTEAGNILAKATKADAAAITNYMGTMYAYFEETAEKMGKSTWVNQLAGQTAMAIQIYKTSGKGMADAMSNVSSAASNQGIAMSEQLAIVGQLQATMSSAAVAGSSYRSFIANLSKA